MQGRTRNKRGRKDLGHLPGPEKLVFEVNEPARPSDCLLKSAGDAALAVGRDVGAVPGPITSLQSRGAHALLADGAYLVRHAQDVLDLLYGAGARTASSSVPELDCELREVLERIGSGQDTVSKLSRDGTRHNDVLVALAELEVRGRVRRLGGGRYVACPS